MKYYVLFLVVLTVVFSASRPKQPLEIATIKASSMVCGTCAKTIEKAGYAVEGVKEVNVDVNGKMVEVKFVSLQTNLQTIELAISESGSDPNNRKKKRDATRNSAHCSK